MARTRHKPEQIVPSPGGARSMPGGTATRCAAGRIRRKRTSNCAGPFPTWRGTRSFSKRLPGEPFEPLALSPMDRSCPWSARDLGTACLPGAGTASLDPAPGSAPPCRREAPGCGPDRAGSPAGPLRLPPHRGPAARRRLVGPRPEDRAPVAARGAEGACQTPETESAVARRRFLCPAPCRAGKPRPVVRLRASPDPGRPGLPQARRAGRVPPREPGHPGPAQALFERCRRRAERSVPPAGRAGPHPFRPRSGVRRQGRAARPSHARFVGRLGSAGSGGFVLVLAFCEAAWYPWWSWNAPRIFSRRLRRVLHSGMWWCAWRGRMRCVAGTVWWTVITILVSSSLRVEVCATCSRGAGGGLALRAGRRAPSAVRRGTVGWVGTAKNSLSGCT